MKELFHKLLRDSAVLLRNLAKRLDEERPGDEPATLFTQRPYWHRHLYGTEAPAEPPKAPWEMLEASGRVSPLLRPENRRAIERVFAKRGFKSGDTVDSVLKESRTL